MSIFQGLGRAIRWLRDRQGKRQYQVADAAGITKAMLSAYETGKQKPSLDTLEKILVALECDLNDLHNALQIVNERPEAIRRPGTVQRENAWQAYRRDPNDLTQEGGANPASLNVYRVLGLRQQLPPTEEEALTQMIEGFHKFVRFLHASASQPPVHESEPTDEEPS